LIVLNVCFPAKADVQLCPIQIFVISASRVTGKKREMNRCFNRLAVLYTAVVLSLFSALATAVTNEDFINTFTGTATLVASCVDPTESGTFTGSWSTTGSNLSGNNYDFLGITDASIDGSIVTFDGVGIISGNTSSGSGTLFSGGSSFGSFTFNNSLSADATTLTTTASGSFFTAGGGCNFTTTTSGTGVASGSGDSVIDPEDTSSSTVTEAVLFNTQIQTQVSDISRHISGALSGRRFFGGPRVRDNEFTMEGATGLNAGDGSTIPYGVWGNYSYSDYDNDLSSTAFDGNSHSFLGGLDFAFWENTVLGVAFGYDNSDIDTTFNGGNQDTDTYTIAPYFGALLTDTLSLDFNVGYSRVEFDQFRTLPGTTTRVSSSPDADRWFGALNLNGITYYDNWILGARVGALWAKSVIDSYTESNGAIVARSRNKLGSGSVAGDVAYSYKNFEPFVNVSYQYDFELTEIAVTTGPQPSNDRDDVLMRVGVRYFDNNNNISGNLEYSKRFDRDDFDEDRISLTVRIDF